jgi:hypothetical protein
MTELTPTAESRLNAYLNELRRVLSGSPAVDPADVERDVRDHIDAALVGEAQPVGDSALNKVLQTLGSPSQWLFESSRPHHPPVVTFSIVKQSMAAYFRHLAGGPESYRLAHWSLLVFVAGWGLALLVKYPFPLAVAMPLSFIFSRAALSLFGVDRVTIGQKWLLYPILVVTYLLLLVVIVVVPVALSVESVAIAARRASDVVTWREISVAVSTALGGTLLALGIVSTLIPGAVRSVFHPFARWWSRRSGLRLMYAGLIGLLIAGLLSFHWRR